MNILFILITSLLWGLDLSAQANDWELSKNKNNIKVYTRQPEGSDIKEFKAITTFQNTTLKKLEAVLDDYPNYPEWQVNVTSAKVVKRHSSDEVVVHYIIEMPWPIDDRDLALHSVKTYSADGKKLTYTSTNSTSVPHKEGYIRIDPAKGQWGFEDQGNGQVKVTYQFLGDPGGKIPTWIINMFIVDGPYDALMKLKERV